MTHRILIKDVQIIGTKNPLIKGWILVSSGKIEQFGANDPSAGLEQSGVDVIDGGGYTIVPGFIDLHTHGAMGHEFMEPDVEAWQALSRYYAAHGTTGVLATGWTASAHDLAQLIETAGKVMGREEGARILGVHLEGPFLNRARSGAQNPALIRTAVKDEVIPYLESGIVRLVALAPEIGENHWLIEECVKRGITVSAGHTDASYADMLEATRMGVTQVTHCFNAMRPLDHRLPGTVGAALTLDELKCELIADNVHVHPAVMKLLARAKGMSGVILITDSIRAAGMPDGEWMLEGQKIFVRNGEARTADGTLAGSTLSLEKGMANFIAATHEPLDRTWVCATLNPAKAIHLEDSKGSIEPGKDADLVLLDRKFEVEMSMVGGRVVYRRNTPLLI